MDIVEKMRITGQIVAAYISETGLLSDKDINIELIDTIVQNAVTVSDVIWDEYNK